MPEAEDARVLSEAHPARRMLADVATGMDSIVDEVGAEGFIGLVTVFVSERGGDFIYAADFHPTDRRDLKKLHGAFERFYVDPADPAVEARSLPVVMASLRTSLAPLLDGPRAPTLDCLGVVSVTVHRDNGNPEVPTFTFTTDYHAAPGRRGEDWRRTLQLAYYQHQPR